MSGSQGYGLSKNSVLDDGDQVGLRNDVDVQAEHVSDLTLQPGEPHQADGSVCVEDKVDVGPIVILARRDGPEDSDVGSSGVPDQSRDLGPMLAQRQSSGSLAVEAEEPGDLGLTAADLVGDLGLGQASGVCRPHRGHEFTARLGYRCV